MTGLDPDPQALARAARKAARARVAVQFDRGFAQDLPYADATFDRVFSSMMFHHLGKADAVTGAGGSPPRAEAGRTLEFLDFSGGTHNPLAKMLHGSQLDAATHERLRSEWEKRD